MSARWAWAALFSLLAACRPSPRHAEAASTATAMPMRGPTRFELGAMVDLRIPLPQGGSLALSELRGRLVLVELVAAQQRDPAIERDYALAAGQDVVIVMVSLDASGWDGDVPPWILGWDPQAALAAQLYAAALPLVLLFDRDGSLLYQYAGRRAREHDAVMAALRERLR